MQTHKTEVLTVRLTPEAKAALREVAGEEQRSLANMLEVMIRCYIAGRPADGGRVPPLANLSARELDVTRNAGRVRGGSQLGRKG